MSFAIPAAAAIVYGLAVFKIDELATEKLERLKDERAYFARKRQLTTVLLTFIIFATMGSRFHFREVYACHQAHRP